MSSSFRGWMFGSMLVLAGGCAGGGALRLGEATPEAIPALEAERAQNPADSRVLARLGVAYFRAQQYDSARAVLDSAWARDSQNGLAAIYLGMTAEAQGDFPAARQAYERYLTVSRSRDLGGTARSRLALLGRRQLEFEARQALVAEATLTQTPPEPSTVAVMPFAYTGTNEDVRPLTRGFAQLVITDLARSRQVTVLERERMQAMLDEMQLSEQGRATPESAVRSGRLLRAARVVQGSLVDIGDNLNATAAVVDVATAVVPTPAQASDQLSRLFDLEKQLVFQIFEGLGIQLTDAEREAVNQRPTQNLQAFLAYSRGLEAGDRGDFQNAAQFFSQAARLDPGFQAAQQGQQQSTDLQAASQQTVGDVDVQAAQQERVESGAGPTTETRQDALTNAMNGVNPPSGAVTQQRGGTDPPAPKDTQAESGGVDRLGPSLGRFILVIVRP